MVTAELELIVGVLAIVWLCTSGTAFWWDFLIAFPIYLLCFMMMQASLSRVAVMRYADVLKKIRANVLDRNDS